MIESFKARLLELGIRKGDILYVASDITQMCDIAYHKYGWEDFDDVIGKIVDCLKDAVGETGTLLLPIYSWAFCRGKGFDVRKTKGEVGALNNWVLKKRKEFQRTQHPIYSFLVWGKDTDKLVAMNNYDAWGEDSPFAYLYRNKGKGLLLGIVLRQGFTFMHYVERVSNVPYRYMKNFSGEYINKQGRKDICNYGMYVRDLDIESEEYLPDSFLEKRNILKGTMWQEQIPLKVINFYDSFNVIKDDLLNNFGQHCYKFTNYKIDWNAGQTHLDEGIQS